MAASTTIGTTASYTATQNRIASRIYRKPTSQNSLPFSAYFWTTKRSRKLLIIRNCTGDLAAESATTTETSGSDTPVEVPKGPPSLISALNVEKALRGIAITDADHYGRLGLTNRCSYGEVNIAYKNKVSEVMNESLSEDEVGKKLELLKESHSILSKTEERRLYDWSLARNDNPDRYRWPFEVDSTPLSTEDPPPREAEDVEPTRLVGYFILTWLMLSLTLLIVFNR